MFCFFFLAEIVELARRGCKILRNRSCVYKYWEIEVGNFFLWHKLNGIRNCITYMAFVTMYCIVYCLVNWMWKHRPKIDWIRRQVERIEQYFQRDWKNYLKWQFRYANTDWYLWKNGYTRQPGVMVWAFLRLFRLMLSNVSKNYWSSFRFLHEVQTLYLLDWTEYVHENVCLVFLERKEKRNNQLAVIS